MATEAQPEPAATPKLKRRWLQFTTRALLVVVTVSGVTLGVVGKGERQRRAVAAVEALGGTVKYPSDWDERERSWLHGWLPRDWIENAVYVELANRSLHDDDLVHFRNLPTVEEAWIGSGRITDAGLAHLRGLKRSHTLVLGHTRLTKSGIEELRRALPECRVREACYVGTGDENEDLDECGGTF
jgi:hypothetical protein